MVKCSPIDISFPFLSQIHIFQNKIHKVIKDICDINKEANLRKTKPHKYKANPNNPHNSGSLLLSGENHHPELDLLTSGEGPEEPSPESSTSAKWLTSMDDTSALSSSTSLTSGRYAVAHRNGWTII